VERSPAGSPVSERYYGHRVWCDVHQRSVTSRCNCPYLGRAAADSCDVERTFPSLNRTCELGTLGCKALHCDVREVPGEAWLFEAAREVAGAIRLIFSPAIGVHIPPPSEQALGEIAALISKHSPGWREIASAPRTGEHVLAAYFGGGVGFGICGGKQQSWQAVVHWWEGEDAGWYLSSGNGDFEIQNLTHWRPLEELPRVGGTPACR
jgi:hypothetical protein